MFIAGNDWGEFYTSLPRLLIEVRSEWSSAYVNAEMGKIHDCYVVECDTRASTMKLLCNNTAKIFGMKEIE